MMQYERWRIKMNKLLFKYVLIMFSGFKKKQMLRMKTIQGVQIKQSRGDIKSSQCHAARHAGAPGFFVLVSW